SRRDVGDETMEAEANALARIEQIQAALENDASSDAPGESPKEGGGENGGDDGGEGGEPGQQVHRHSLAELKLLKAIQEQLNSRTLALAEGQQAGAAASEAQQQEFADLSRDQGRLADIVTNMMQATDDRPEDDPSKLPDIRRPSAARPDSESQEEQP